MNMSDGGFSFETQGELPLRASFGFEIKNEDGSVAIEARGQVRWCSPSQEREGCHWVGVMFEPLSEEEAGRIRSFVKEQTVDENEAP